MHVAANQANSYKLPRRGGNLPPVESATPFSSIFPHNVQNIIAATPRAKS